MRLLALLMVVGCGGGATSTSTTFEPTPPPVLPPTAPAVSELDLLVGSWATYYGDDGFGNNRLFALEIRADGTFAEAEYEDLDRPKCIRAGRVAIVQVEESWDRKRQGYTDTILSLSFTHELDSCRDHGRDSDSDSTRPLTGLSADDFWVGSRRFLREDGPQVTPEMIATAFEYKRLAWDHINDGYVPTPDEPDEPDKPDEPDVPYVPDPRVTTLKAMAMEFASGIASTGYTYVSDSIWWTASWVAVPYMKPNTSYAFVILVSSAASDADANLEMDGERLGFTYATSDEGGYFALTQYATSGTSGYRTRDEGGLTVVYSSSYDEPALLLVLELVDP